MLFVCVSCLRFLLSRALFLSVTCSHGVRIDRSWRRRRRRRVSVIWWVWVEGWAGWWASAPRWNEKREGEGKGVLVDTQSSQWLTGSEWAPTGKLVLTLSPFARVKLSRECLWCVREGVFLCSLVSEWGKSYFLPRARFLCGYCYLRSTSRWPTITIISNNFILSLRLPLSTRRRHRRKSLLLLAIVVCDQLGIKLPTAKKVKKFFLSFSIVSLLVFGSSLFTVTKN